MTTILRLSAQRVAQPLSNQFTAVYFGRHKVIIPFSQSLLMNKVSSCYLDQRRGIHDPTSLALCCSFAVTAFGGGALLFKVGKDTFIRDQERMMGFLVAASGASIIGISTLFFVESLSHYS